MRGITAGPRPFLFSHIEVGCGLFETHARGLAWYCVLSGTARFHGTVRFVALSGPGRHVWQFSMPKGAGWRLVIRTPAPSGPKGSVLRQRSGCIQPAIRNGL